MACVFLVAILMTATFAKKMAVHSCFKIVRSAQSLNVFNANPITSFLSTLNFACHFAINLITINSPKQLKKPKMIKEL